MMTTGGSMENLEENSEDQRPRQQSLGGVLRREGNWRCLLLSALLAGCLGAAIWCRLAQVQKVVINFSVYPIKRTRQMSPCDDGYIYIPVAFMGLLYLVYLVECYHCTARLQLAHRVDVSAVADRVRAMRMAKPKVWWKAVCYHYVRRKRQVTRYRNGDSYTTTQVYYERVNTHSASATFVHAYCGYKDVSRNLILDSRGPITKIRFSKGFAFSNLEAASEFEDQRSRFFADHERFGDYMEMREGLDLVGVSSFKEYMVAYRDTDSMPWYSSHALFWVLSCLLLSWPLRILIECNTSYVHYTVTKIFGVNYDIEANRRHDLERISHYPSLSSTSQSPRRPPPEVILSNQSAVLPNQNVGACSNNSSTQHINILALARSRNNLDQSAMMSHTSTIDSLELFATIRENCALVPSYSEALLLSSLNNEIIAPENTSQIVQEINPVNKKSKEIIKNRPNLISNSTEDSPSMLLNTNVISNPTSSKNSLNNSPSIQQSIEQNRRIVPSTSAVENVNCNNESPDTIPICKDAQDRIRRNSENQCGYQSAIISNNVSIPRRKIRIVEEFNNTSSDDNCSNLVDTDDDCGSETTSNKSPLRIHTTQSNYSLKTNNNYILIDRDKNNPPNQYKIQNRKSWAGFLSKPMGGNYSHLNRNHGSARIRPIPLLSCRKNSLTDSLLKGTNGETTDHTSIITCENEIIAETLENRIIRTDDTIPLAQIETIDRNLFDEDNRERRHFFFASPLLGICPDDPFGGRVQTTPTEDPPPYEVAVNLPVLRRITRSVTDRGELFGQSRAFISDTLLNRRSCVDNIVSSADAVRLLECAASPNGRGGSDMETNL